MPVLVDQLLAESARERGDAIALIDAKRAVTYRELDALANQFANLFVNAGVRCGDRVVLALDNSIEFAAAYFGAMKAAGVAVPLPPGPKSDRLTAAIADCRPAVCVIDAPTAADPSAAAALAAIPAVLVHGSGPVAHNEKTRRPLSSALPGMPTTAPRARHIDLDLAAIIYTSGSTGAPRGVMLTHRNIVANTTSIVEYLGLTSTDRVMCVLPFYYVYGLSLLHTHIAVGGSVVIDNRFAYPNVVLAAMQEHRVTGFAGVPSTFAILLHRSNLDTVALPDLRYVTQAGGNMPTAHVAQWLERGPKVPFFVMYGATEASARLTYVPPAELTRKLGSVGRPIPNVEILVVKDDGSLAGPGEEGELVARGSNIAIGYWNSPAETAERFGSGGYRTGDMGYVDPEGFLFLVGRRHDMMKIGAHRVGSKEIEDVLHEFPDVREAAVVAEPHDLMGEVPVAFVSVARPEEFEILQLRNFCKSRLATHKVPSRFVLMADLPKMPGVAKIDKVSLRRSLASRPAGDGTAETVKQGS